MEYNDKYSYICLYQLIYIYIISSTIYSIDKIIFINLIVLM